MPAIGLDVIENGVALGADTELHGVFALSLRPFPKDLRYADAQDLLLRRF